MSSPNGDDWPLVSSHKRSTALWRRAHLAALRRVGLVAAVVLAAPIAVVGSVPTLAGAATLSTSSNSMSKVVSTLSGSYSGHYFVGDAEGVLTFYVAPNGKAIEDVSANVGMTCSPGTGGPGGWPFVIDSLKLPASGTFATTSSEAGDYSGNPAKFTFNFQGEMTGTSPGGAPEGSLTETMTYSAGGTAYHCTSTQLSWSAARDIQPSQPKTPPPSGSYSGDYYVSGTQGGLTFYVAPNGKAIEDVSANVGMTCSPGDRGPGGWPFVIDSLKLPASGTFATTSSETGDYSGNPAKLTFEFQGHVHGVSPGGAPRLAGSLTETMTYSAGGTTYSCTSNKLPWYATRDTQPSPQPKTPPPSGSYSGDYYVGGTQGGLTFSVASSGKAIEDVSANVGMTCSPGDGGPGGWPFVIDSLKLPASGTFATTSTEAGKYSGNPATFTFDFQGHVHGVSPAGAPRLAGSLTLTMTYSAGGTTYSCTSNKLSWYATGP